MNFHFLLRLHCIDYAKAIWLSKIDHIYFEIIFCCKRLGYIICVMQAAGALLVNLSSAYMYQM